MEDLKQQLICLVKGCLDMKRKTKREERKTRLPGWLLEFQSLAALDQRPALPANDSKWSITAKERQAAAKI